MYVSIDLHLLRLNKSRASFRYHDEGNQKDAPYYALRTNFLQGSKKTLRILLIKIQVSGKMESRDCHKNGKINTTKQHLRG